jgi:hypothetical protein
VVAQAWPHHHGHRHELTLAIRGVAYHTGEGSYGLAQYDWHAPRVVRRRRDLEQVRSGHSPKRRTATRHRGSSPPVPGRPSPH